VPLGPLPLLLELLRERVRVLERRRVAACTGVAVPVPRPADAAARFVDADVEPAFAGAIEHVHAREARADDHRVELSCGRQHSSSDASRAPSLIDRNFAQTMLGAMIDMPAPVPKPQSLPAMTFSRPTTPA